MMLRFQQTALPVTTRSANYGIVWPKSRGSRARFLTRARVALPRDTCRLARAQTEQTKSKLPDAKAQRRKGRLQHSNTWRDVMVSSDCSTNVL